jgi:hypothetical protein
MSRNSSPFTREDEKDLFKDDPGPNFLDSFRSFYTGGNSAESCSVVVTIDLNHATVDEIESCETTAALIGVESNRDRYTTTLKLPDSIRKLELAVSAPDETSALDSESTFLIFLAGKITEFQLQKVLRENPNKYKCATCQKTPVTEGVSMDRRGVDDTTWKVSLSPCFPVCDSIKCTLIVTKCVEKMVSKLASVTGGEVFSSRVPTQCSNCNRFNL